MATAPAPASAQHKSESPPPDVDLNRIREERAAEARKIFDGYDDDDDLPLTTQTDQLRRSMDMERVGPEAYMLEAERRIRDRQGDPPPEPRQVHGVAPVQKPR